MSPPISHIDYWSRRLAKEFGPVHLVRVGENALWHAPRRDLAIRLYRHDTTSHEKARREISAATMLATHSVPVIQPAEHDPVTIDRRAATLWEWCPTTGAPVDPHAFGTLLRAAHVAWQSGPHDDHAFSDFDPISKVVGRLEHLGALKELPLLKQRVDEAAVIWSDFESCAPRQIIHGDAHAGNVLVTPDGLVLADFDETKVGPVEWDLVSMIIGHLRFGRSRDDLDAFAAGIGADDRMLQGAWALAPVKELSALTWLGTRALEDAGAHKELRRRLGVSSEGEGAIWRPL